MKLDRKYRMKEAGKMNSLLKKILFLLSWGGLLILSGLAKELGIRLGQTSEFSLLAAYGAFASGKIEARTSYLIQLATISTFIISTYFVVYKYPTPISVRASKRQD